MDKQTGQWKGKAVIQGRGHHLRGSLAIPALVAMSCKPDLSAKDQAPGAAGKTAIPAIRARMRKLVDPANIPVKNDRKWMPKAARPRRMV